MTDENHLSVVVALRVCRYLLLLPRARAGHARESSNIREDAPQGDIYVGIDDDGGEEDGDAPAMREGISQVKPIAIDPAPVTTNVPVGAEQEADSTCSRQVCKRS